MPEARKARFTGRIPAQAQFAAPHLECNDGPTWEIVG